MIVVVGFSVAVACLSTLVGLARLIRWASRRDGDA